MKGLLALIILIFAVLLAAWGGAVYYGEAVNNAHSMQYADTMQTVTQLAWEFVRPLLQLIVILIVLEWFLKRSGIQISFTQLGITWDARLLVAIIVIVTFCIVSLSGIDDRGIKEAALVVIGFYFGSAQRKDGQKASENQSTAPSAPPPNP